MTKAPGKLLFNSIVRVLGGPRRLRNLLKQWRLGCIGQKLVIEVEDSTNCRIGILGQFQKPRTNRLIICVPAWPPLRNGIHHLTAMT